MRYEIRNELVRFYLDNPKRAKETTVTQSFVGSGLSEKNVIALLDSLVKKLRGQSLSSQKNMATYLLRPLFAYFRTAEKSWPATSAEWQLTIYRFFQFYLSDTNWSQAKTGPRMDQWQTVIGGTLEFLIEDEIIPRDVKIPKIDSKKIRSLAKNQPLLSQSRPRVSDVSSQPKKLLVDISFGRTDAYYLDDVERQCRHIVGVIRETCLEHWYGLMRDGETGRQLAAQVPDAELDEVVATRRYDGPHPQRGLPKKYASPSDPKGHARALAIVRWILSDGADIGCISRDAIRASPFFPNQVFGANEARRSYTALDALTAMTQEQWGALTTRARFHRFAGLISNVDAAAACCLLTIEHPEFTSETLQDAKLLNVRGNPYLLLTDNHEHSILSIDKPRAGQRKSVVLTAVSQKLVSDILRWSAPVREVLRRAGDKTWRYLFLGVKYSDGVPGFLGVVEGTTNYLTSGGASTTSTTSLTTLYPVLVENGLAKGSFDYRRLRNTLAVIRWFETGSILEMSRRLGNTRKVALEHYLPAALLHAWNTRIIRRFQNTLIVLAAHDEPYLLEVTDFSNMADLQHLITQLIVDYPARTSPLADEVQRRLGSDQQREELSLALMPGLLNVRLSPKSLGLLYSYADLALRTLAPDELDKIDVLSGLAPRQFTDMAALLRHAAESDKIHAALRETLDVPLLKQVHGNALAIQVGLDAQFAKLAIKHCWADSP